MARNNDTDFKAVNLIAGSTKVSGKIETENDIRIDGTLEGNLTTSGRLVVGSKGKISGEIVCKSAEIEGEIKGKIDVTELIALKESAYFDGEILTNKIIIEAGANFTGNCNMKNISSGKSK